MITTLLAGWIGVAILFVVAHKRFRDWEDPLPETRKEIV